MASEDKTTQDRIDQFIDQNLKKVFSELENDEMPGEIVDLLTVLRAQDKEMQGKE